MPSGPAESLTAFTAICRVTSLLVDSDGSSLLRISYARRSGP